MASFDYNSERGDYGARSQLATLYGQSPVTTQRQSMIGSDDIQSYSIQAARIQAMIDQWENALSETDSQMFPMKAALIKAKLRRLRYDLAWTQAGLGSAGAMAAVEQDAINWAVGEKAAGRAEIRADLATGNLMAYPIQQQPTTTYTASPTYSDMTPDTGYTTEINYPTQQAYSQFSLSQYQPTYDKMGGYQPMGPYSAPAWMQQGYLTPYGEVRPIGAQEELGALQQAQLWEQGAMRGVNTIEEYLEREPYIQLYGEELTARSKALAPKTYQRKAQWNRALQR